MTADVPLIGAGGLESLVAIGDMAGFGPLGERRYLALDLREGADRNGAEASIWLAALPCPVLAVGTISDTPPTTCDVVVEHPDALTEMVARIEAAPFAAMVLVQLLRAGAGMNIGAALLAESLAYATLQAGPDFARWRAGRGPVASRGHETGDAVRLDRDTDTLRIQLNRPLTRNAICMKMRDGLCEALDLACHDSEIRKVELTGAGRCFSVGGDLAEFGTAPDPASGHAVRSLRLPASRMLPLGGRVHARLHGACIGAGIELAAFADRVTAAPNSFFQLPEIRFGLIPGAGGTVSITRRIGRQRMAWLALSARRISAARALQWGLIDEIAG